MDTDHAATAKGFSVNELDEKIQAIK